MEEHGVSTVVKMILVLMNLIMMLDIQANGPPPSFTLPSGFESPPLLDSKPASILH